MESTHPEESLIKGYDGVEQEGGTYLLQDALFDIHLSVMAPYLLA